MTDVWSDRAQAYRDSPTHAGDADLDTVVEMCNPHEGKKFLDVASGGGHVARRLREHGAEVVTLDPAPGMRADVLAPAEHIPFGDGSFDCVVTRIAPHHFTAIGEALGEMVRVSNRELVIEDTLYISEEHEQAEKLRDPSHVRSYTEEEWRDMLEDAGLELERVEYFEKTHVTDEWLARTGCTGDEAARVRDLLRPVSSEDGRAWRDTKILIKARKSQK
ncbi:MAG TPA: methyltransferase domain-containing protein, partial [Gaiellaceae bacterium]